MQRDYGYDTTWIAPQDLPGWIASPRFHSGIHDPLGGHLHPLKYSLGLARAAASLGVHSSRIRAVTAIVPGRVARSAPCKAASALRTCCWPATSTCRASRRCSRAA